eukprot:CAMPEP_0113525002 /NCGR_PEP_ID=MMETSP0014_2-20120614/46504_1 /TAXON_ID=2857 /ORGANISM="Nitzschia sp." /LENGTH=1473 /DNA_ID=CAMNT_0000423125 /DNA_START=65 /DNA_END=4486 /DNA_ORIENTATION=+ /assembly_acc=CAM_ASM_000159
MDNDYNHDVDTDEQQGGGIFVAAAAGGVGGDDGHHKDDRHAEEGGGSHVERNDDDDDNNSNNNNNNNNNNDQGHHHQHEEEEEECRVCRGEAEEGRPLFTPCKCSGSMGKIHQDCLVSWLEVTRGDGRCEICKHKFRFEPQYAPDAPEKLPTHEVVLGLSNRFIAKWLPLALRLCVAISLWLVAAPLLTNCLYHGWLVRPSSIFTRWKRELIMSDIISGAVTTGVIIISFLSLMSFADFLRVHWQQEPGNRQDGAAAAAGGVPAAGDRQHQNAGRLHRQNDRNNNNNNANGQDRDAFDDDEDNDSDQTANVDRGIIEFIEQELATNEQQDTSLAPEKDTSNSSIVELDDSFTQTGIDIDSISRGLDNRAVTEQDPSMADDENDDSNNDNVDKDLHQHPQIDETRTENDVEDDPIIGIENDMPPLVDHGAIVLGDDDDASLNSDDNAGDDRRNNDGEIAVENVADGQGGDLQDNNAVDNNADADGREEAVAFDPIDPILQDDQVDMEINVALDELLGLRGPLSVLVRNLLWLLAFNATYLGIFGFVPKTFGYFVYSGFFNTTTIVSVMKSVPFLHSENENRTTIVSILSKVEEESVHRETTFKLSDFATVTLGYLFGAFCIVLVKYGVMFFTKAGQRFGMEQTYARIAAANNRENEGARPVARREAVRRDRLDALNDDAVDEDVLGISAALDAAVAIVKVGVLLFLKMFMLPLSLGIVLDASTFQLFGHQAADRLAFAGSDLFSFILLHWVAGITFMLLVTVFLLQLREVFHPDILGGIIRPQEPQPDLLGNLMNETVPTHMKRMALSLAIYAPLMALHVTLPAKLFVASGFGGKFTFFNLHFFYLLMPQLQIPVELIIFHLSMLALLERYKNTIGGLQHGWMKFMCRRMGLTDFLLPRAVKSFELVGSKAVFSALGNGASGFEVDPFFLELINKTDDIDNFVLSNIDKENDPVIHGEVRGETKESGDRVLSIDVDSISIPAPNTDPEASSSTDPIPSLTTIATSTPTSASTQRTKLDQAGSLPEKEHIKLLPTKVGRYRLRLEECGPSSQAKDLRIEFFREVPGSEISRPPKGWDDLSSGGAFVQGRWAWGKERMSPIERSVSHRTPFRTPNRRIPIILTFKVAALTVFSWVAVTLTVLGLVSVPLFIGRSFYRLFHIPDAYVHDPFAFCIGAGLFFPLSNMLSTFFHDNDQDVTTKIRAWSTHMASRFSLPPASKALVLLETLFLWFVAAPLLFGASYQFTFVKSSTWFAGEEQMFAWKSLIVSWFMGIVVLNTWSFLLYFELFTRKFWAIIGNGILEAPVVDDNAQNGQRNNGGRGVVDAANDTQAEQHEMGAWQGKHGRVSRYYHTWKSILDGWQWDRVDKTVLLDDFTRPVAKHLASSLLGSFLSFFVVHAVIVLIFSTEEGGIALPGDVDMGTVNRFLFRFCMAMHIVVQIIANCQESISRAFEIAHEAARDDRYLVGELLIDFNRDD